MKARNFNQGFSTIEYLASAFVDMELHAIEDQSALNVDAFERGTLDRLGMPREIVMRHRIPHFLHIMGGYAAGYYAYIWSEVLDADSVEWFKQNGGLTRKNGDHFRDTLLSRGGSEDAVTLFKSFSGREPYVEPLLVRRGLVTQPAPK